MLTHCSWVMSSKTSLKSLTLQTQLKETNDAPVNMINRELSMSCFTQALRVNITVMTPYCMFVPEVQYGTRRTQWIGGWSDWWVLNVTYFIACGMFKCKMHIFIENVPTCALTQHYWYLGLSCGLVDPPSYVLSITWKPFWGVHNMHQNVEYHISHAQHAPTVKPNLLFYGQLCQREA